MSYNGSCFEGQAAIETCQVDLCRVTSMGPLCGKCKWTNPHSYLKDERCYRCKGGEVALVISVLIFVVVAPLTVALVLYRFIRIRAFSYRIYRYDRSPLLPPMHKQREL